MADRFNYFPGRGGRETQVYIRWCPNEQMQTVEDVMTYLREKAPVPVLLSQELREDHLTVTVCAIGVPHIVFGRSAPTGNSDSDLEEIVRVLEANDLKVKVVTRP